MNYQELFEEFREESYPMRRCNVDYDLWKHKATRFAKWLVKKRYLKKRIGKK